MSNELELKSTHFATLTLSIRGRQNKQISRRATFIRDKVESLSPGVVGGSKSATSHSFMCELKWIVFCACCRRLTCQSRYPMRRDFSPRVLLVETAPQGWGCAPAMCFPEVITARPTKKAAGDPGGSRGGSFVQCAQGRRRDCDDRGTNFPTPPRGADLACYGKFTCASGACPDIVFRAPQTFPFRPVSSSVMVMVSPMKLTEASIKQNIAPPGWKLPAPGQLLLIAYADR